MAVLLGVAVGALTSFGQSHLEAPLSAFVNSASAWLVAPFVIGAFAAGARSAAGAGLITCLTQLVGYYLTSKFRGFATGSAILAFWAVCALVGGPVFGLAGQIWRAGPPRLRGLGGAILSSAFLAEGLWLYLHVLGYTSTAWLWIAIGLAITALTVKAVSDLRWILLTLPLGIVAEIILATVYKQSF